jgi:hypothetical protein
VRDVLIYLNQSQNQNINPELIINSNFEGSSVDYWAYRNVDNTIIRQFKGNSLYFYFGTEPGLTALDKMNSKYFTKCIQSGSQAFIIEGTTANVTVIGGSDGSITINNIIGGTTPFSYEWSNGYTSQNLTNLLAGEYVLVVTDFNEDRVRKVFTIDEPAPLNFEVTGNNLTSLTTNNGSVSVNNLTGGNSPYSVTINGPGGVQIINNITADGCLFENLWAGDHNVSVTDNSTPQLTVSKTVKITTPKILKIITSRVNSECYGESNGSIDIDIITGNPPYVVSVTSTDAYMTILNDDGVEEDVLFGSSDLVNYNLAKGTYDILVTDTSSQQYSKTIIITEPTEPPIIREYNPTSKLVRVSGDSTSFMYLNDVMVGSPYYHNPLSISITDKPRGHYFDYQNLTVEDETCVNVMPGDEIYFEDSNGCKSEKITYPFPPNDLTLERVPYLLTNEFKLKGVVVNEPYVLYFNGINVETKTWDGVGLNEITFNTSESSLGSYMHGYSGYIYCVSLSSDFNDRLKISNKLVK